MKRSSFRKRNAIGLMTIILAFSTLGISDDTNQAKMKDLAGKYLKMWGLLFFQHLHISCLHGSQKINWTEFKTFLSDVVTLPTEIDVYKIKEGKEFCGGEIFVKVMDAKYSADIQLDPDKGPVNIKIGYDSPPPQGKPIQTLVLIKKSN